MIGPRDIQGLQAIMPTPAKPGADRLEATDTVDVAETERMVNALLADGAQGLIALGTTGECAALSPSDYRTFVDCVLAVVAGRVPTFIGTTALGGHEVLARSRFAAQHGADGVLLGLPMWQPVSTDMAVDFYRTMSEAMPDLAIMVYANARAFRYTFPLDFWAAVAREAPTVIAAKYSRPKDLPALLDTVDGRIHVVPNEMTTATFYAAAPETTTACWATAATMGPAAIVALMDAVKTDDAERVAELHAALSEANQPVEAIFRDPEIFATYNTQVEKARINAAGYCASGPCRPPYNHLPEEYAEAAAECGRRWRELHLQYSARSRPLAGSPTGDPQGGAL